MIKDNIQIYSNELQESLHNFLQQMFTKFTELLEVRSWKKFIKRKTKTRRK